MGAATSETAAKAAAFQVQKEAAAYRKLSAAGGPVHLKRMMWKAFDKMCLNYFGKVESEYLLMLKSW